LTELVQESQKLRILAQIGAVWQYKLYWIYTGVYVCVWRSGCREETPPHTSYVAGIRKEEEEYDEDDVDNDVAYEARDSSEQTLGASKC
jgi:hypothetical protein